MADDDDLHPVIMLNPSEDGLDLAASIAVALGEPFDRAGVAAQARTLHETMFDDLMKSLSPDGERPAFNSGIYPVARSFAGVSKHGVSHVVLDLIFDFWVFATGHLMVVKATKNLDDIESRELRDALTDLFSLFVDNHRFTHLRDRLRPFLLPYPDCLNLSHAMTRSMTVSVLCHEYAHITLGHLQERTSPEQEFAADARGGEYFLAHVGNSSARDTTVYVDPKIAGAPVLLLRIFALYEHWLTKDGKPLASNHPPARERAARLDALVRPHLTERAVYILDGMSAALEDLKNEL